MIGPCRDALCAALGQPKNAAWHAGAGPPPRVAASVPQPSARDLQRLRKGCHTLCCVLSDLRGQIEEPQASENDASLTSSAPAAAVVSDAQDSGTGPVNVRVLGIEPSGASAESASSSASEAQVAEVRVAELQGVVGRLSTRARELEAPAARAADLERVAEKLRIRVKDLEMQEARIDMLRQECSALRMRIAELIASAVQTEEEHRTLLTHVGRLELRLKEGDDPADPPS